MCSTKKNANQFQDKSVTNQRPLMYDMRASGSSRKVPDLEVIQMRTQHKKFVKIEHFGLVQDRNRRLSSVESMHTSAKASISCGDSGRNQGGATDGLEQWIVACIFRPFHCLARNPRRLLQLVGNGSNRTAVTMKADALRAEPNVSQDGPDAATEKSPYLDSLAQELARLQHDNVMIGSK
jgi:hypothetical protein